MSKKVGKRDVYEADQKTMKSGQSNKNYQSRDETIKVLLSI